MKVILFILTLFAIAIFSISCGSSKKTIEAQNKLIEQQLNAAKKQTRPTRRARTLDPCEVLALEPSALFRAAGTAIAKSESEAKNTAATDARRQLAQMIRVVVDGASKDYSKNVMASGGGSYSSVGEDVMNEYVYQSVEFTKPIKWSIYDLSDGTMQVYVCMEMTKKPEDIRKEFDSRYLNSGRSSSGARVNPKRFVANVIFNPAAEALFEQGRDYCFKNDHDLGIPLLMEAIDMGSANALYFVGLMYLYGDNVKKDSKIAFKYISSATSGGHKKAVFQLAEMYNSGTGVRKDKKQAEYWYRIADELGDTRAESRLRRF